MKRNEVKEELKWDLKPLFESQEQWDQEYEKLDALVKNWYRLKDTLTNDVNSFIDFYKAEVILDNAYTKLYMYAHLNSDADTTNEENQKVFAKIVSVLSKYANEFAEIEECVNNNVDKILEIVRSEEKLTFLEKKYTRIKEDAKYKLTEAEEKIIAKLSNSTNAMQEGFSALDNKDIVFEDVVDSEGKSLPLTHATYSLYTESKDETLRKDAFVKYSTWYKDHRNSYANNLYYNFKYLNDIAEVRGFEDALDASLFADRSNRKVVDTLLESVNENHELEFKFYDVLKRLTGKDTLNRWDLGVNPIEVELDFSIEEQKEIMLNISKIFQHDYYDVVKKIFDERWIDWEANDGKRSGAYSSGYQKSNKYILLNDNGTLNALSTLVHEIGHSMHSFYASENNAYEFGKYSIIEAEIASTLNEMILYDYLLTYSKSNKEKILYLLKLINVFRGTIYRQSMFAEFEVNVNDRVKAGEMLTAKDFEDIYQTLIDNYFGDAVEGHELWKYEAFRIPHFYYNFYVYKYATGLTTSIALYNNIKKDYANSIEKVFDFLKEGSKLDPLDVIRKAGVDLEEKQTYTLAFDQLETWINQLDKLVTEEYGK